jgi:hypothetical protein
MLKELPVAHPSVSLQCNVFVRLCPPELAKDEAEPEPEPPNPPPCRSSGASVFRAAIARSMGDMADVGDDWRGAAVDCLAVAGRVRSTGCVPSRGGDCITASAEALTEENLPDAV